MNDYYAAIESAKNIDELNAAIETMSHLTERERGTLSELVAQRQAEFSKENA